MAIENSIERPSSTRWAMAGLSLSTLLSSLGTSIANVALPALARAFDAPFHGVQWIVLAYLLSMTVLMVSAGRLGDVTGRRRLLLAGILLFTASSIACAVAPTLRLLVAARAAQGVGAAIMMAMTMALAGELMPKARTGSAMGLLGTMSAIGTALGPSLGGVLIAGAGWRAIFLVNVPLGIATFLIAHRHLPIDRVATAGASASTRPGTPVLTLLRDRSLAASLATNALVSAVMMATLVVGPFYLSSSLGLGPAAVGFAMSAGPLATALTSVMAGRLVDGMGAPGMTLAGLATLAAGAFILALLPATLGVPGYVGPIVVMTIGYALFQAANNTAVMTS
ncbi:MAG: MFS transporter, partial [Vicinamibacterales bacterium]